MTIFTTFLDHEIIKSSQKVTAIQKSRAEEELRYARDNVRMQLFENIKKKKNCHLMEPLLQPDSLLQLRKKVEDYITKLMPR